MCAGWVGWGVESKEEQADGVCKGPMTCTAAAPAVHLLRVGSSSSSSGGGCSGGGGSSSRTAVAAS